MSASEDKYTGRWLHSGEWHGKDFSHEMAEYDHDESPGSAGATSMRHAYVDIDGQSVGVWVPAGWTHDQAREALESNY